MVPSSVTAHLLAFVTRLRLDFLARALQGCVLLPPTAARSHGLETAKAAALCHLLQHGATAWRPTPPHGLETTAPEGSSTVPPPRSSLRQASSPPPRLGFLGLSLALPVLL